MICTSCGGKLKCLDTRHHQKEKLMRRRYACNDCGGRFYSIEVFTEKSILLMPKESDERDRIIKGIKDRLYTVKDDIRALKESI